MKKGIMIIFLTSFLMMGNSQCNQPAPEKQSVDQEWREIKTTSMSVSIVSIETIPDHTYIAIVDFYNINPRAMTMRNLKVNTDGGNLIVNDKVYPVSKKGEIHIYFYKWMYLPGVTRLILDMSVGE